MRCGAPLILLILRSDGVFGTHSDRILALSFLEPLGEQIQAHGLGTLSEIADGEIPAQAWTVGETLRAWRSLVS